VRTTARRTFTLSAGFVPAVLAGLLALAGLVLRLQDFGRYGFWNDEAWVALSTRVGWSQFWLALGPTPVGWAALLQVFALLPGRPEVTLRLLPLVFGTLTLWAAWRTGVALAGVGAGLLALAAVAFDPTSIVFAKVLKPYTAEAFLALLAFLVAIRFVGSRGARDLVALSLLLGLGVLFANSQLFLAPPLLAALLVHAIWRREWQVALRVAAAGVAVAAWDAAAFALVIAPRMLPSLVEYWAESYVPTGSTREAVAFIGQSLLTLLGPAGRPATVVAACAAIVALLAVVPRARPIGLALVLLVAELAVLSALRRLPLNEPRVMLFLGTILLIVGAAGIGLVLTRLGAWSWGRPAAAAGFVLLLYDLTAHPALWRSRDHLPVEDVGPLIQLLEETRAPGDHVLVYGRSGYTYAYYQRPRPLLIRAQGTTVGFVPLLPDPQVTAVDPRNAPEAVDQAFAMSPQVWFVGSRFRGDDQRAIVQRLAARGHVVLTRQRPNALLVAVRRSGG